MPAEYRWQGSAIHFRDCLIRLVSCYTLLRRFQLPWPHPNCLYQTTRFMVSVTLHLGTLAQQSVRSRIAIAAYQQWPTSRYAFNPVCHLSTQPAHTRLKFPTEPRMLHPLSLRKISLRGVTALTNDCYPEGNFGGNQLLACSMSISLLHPGLRIDLHVRTPSNFHQSFP